MNLGNIFDQHLHIGLDLDETLASTVQGALDHAHSEGKLMNCHCFDDIHFYDFTEVDDSLTVAEASKIWEDYGKLTMLPESVPLIPGAREGIDILLGQGKDLSIITARSNHESWKVDRTIDWIRAHFPEISHEKVAFVNHFYNESRPKSLACQERGVTLMIDDSLENAYDLSHAGIGCILLEKPWNRATEYAHPLVYRVKDWAEINDQLIRHYGYKL